MLAPKIWASAAVLLLLTTPAAAQMFDSVAVGDNDLGRIAGKVDLSQAVIAENSATVAGNQVIGNSTTGVINIADNAFQSLNGLAIISANTGNNVAINASLNVNVAIRP